MAIPWITRTRKPHSQVRVNQAHPLARDIAFFYYETAGVVASKATFYDAVTGKLAAVSAANTAISSTDPIGGGRSNIFCNNGNTASSTTAFTNPRGINTNFVTVFARIKPTAKPGSKTQVVSYGTTDASRNSYIGINSSGNALGGIGNSNGMVFANDGVDWTGKWVNIGGSGDGTGATGFGWVNGVALASSTSGSSAGSTVQSAAFGRDPANYYNGFTGEIAVFIGWNRILTNAEHKALSNNPWQILEPYLNPIYFSQDNGTAGIAGDLAYTEVQDAWAISASVRIDGDAAWTEAQDAWAISATVSGGGVTGDAAWTEIQDTWAVAGQTGVFGAGAWIEGQDAWNISGQTGVFGDTAWTEVQDAWNASGTVSLPSVTGDAAWTEAQDAWNIQASNGLIDTHDGGPKRRKRHEEQKKKEEKDYRDRQERRRQQMIAAFEQVIEGNVSRETSIEQVIEPAATYAVQTPEIAQKSDFDFTKWLQNLDNAQRILDDYLEADDEEVLVFL